MGTGSGSGVVRVRTCRKCETSYQVASGCPTCQRASQAAYRARHRESARERTAAWRLANPGAHDGHGAAWRKEHPAGARKHSTANLLGRYGLTPADYASMLAAQGGACAICRRTPTDGKVLCVDHHHGSGRVRALLCHGCNNRVGAFESSLASATREYLRAHEDL